MNEQGAAVASDQGSDFEVVRITDKFHSYRVGSGPQFNAGESMRVPKREAEKLVAEGAAVRISVATPDVTRDEKALAHPIKDKMVKSAATK